MSLAADIFLASENVLTNNTNLTNTTKIALSIIIVNLAMLAMTMATTCTEDREANKTNNILKEAVVPNNIATVVMAEKTLQHMIFINFCKVIELFRVFYNHNNK